MSDKNGRKTTEDPSDSGAEGFERWLREMKSALPEPFEKAVDDATDWVKRHPTAALAIGVAGASLTLFGGGRLVRGARIAARHPIVGALATKAAASLVSRAKKN